MTSFWSLISPLATTNLVTNPSVELATTGYTAVGGSIARVTTDRFFGMACLAVTPTSSTTDGVYYGTVSLTTGTTYTASVYVKGVAGIPYKIYFANTSGTLKGTATTFTGTGDWQRVEVSWVCDSTTTYRIYVTKNSHASTGVFNVDGLQCEAQTAASTYCDGDQDECSWSGGKHASASTRTARTRAGGQIVDVESLGYHVEDLSGIGMPEIGHRVRSHPLLSGGELVGYSIRERAFQLVGTLSGSSQANLHSLRKALINALKLDAVTDETEPVLFRYSGANSAKEIEIGANYDAGLEFTGLDGFSEDVAARFIAYDPFWRDVRDSAASLTATTSVANANYILSKINGAWQALGTGMNGIVYDIKAGPDGSIYACGAFTTAGGTTVNRVAKWDGSAWSALGTGMNGDVFCIVIDSAGNIYAGGAFTTADGGGANRVAKWNGSAWSALGTGMNEQVDALTIGGDGNLYAGGYFTTAGGTTVNYVAKWDGSAWSAMGATGMNYRVFALAAGPDGTIYAGGQFTTAGGTTVAHVAHWTGTAWEAVGTEIDDNVRCLKILANGTIYAGGDFTPGDLNYIAKWDGAVWSALGTGQDDTVRTMDYDLEKNLLYVGGDFTMSGGSVIADKIALWNGSLWMHSDIDPPGSPATYAILLSNGNMYIGFNTSGTATSSYSSTINNGGTRAVYPIIKIKRSGGTTARLEWIKNETTGKTMWFNYSMLDGEELTIDLRPTRRKITSSYYGDVWRALLRGSDFAGWQMLPGDNIVTNVISSTGSPTITAYAYWKNLYWSADGVAA